MSALKYFLLATIVVSSAYGQTGPFTADFQKWLSANGYGSDNFNRPDLGNWASFGGKTTSSQKLHHDPVIFIHGNSDCALNSGTGQYETGWTNSIRYFQNQGYSSAELYATTWGDANSANAQSRRHNCQTVQYLRRFVEAVIAYTKASKVDIISHSMGVTLARKVVKGGSISASDGSCNIGAALTDKVDTFLGISGGNYGLCTCQGFEANIAPTCSKDNGYWPGDSCGAFDYLCGFPMPTCTTTPTYSSYMTELNTNSAREGKYVFVAYSLTDEILMNQNNVWNHKTSSIPGSNGEKIYPSYTHMQTKEQTAADQYNCVVNHSI
uniref:Triacylglycerol lipase n=1 Tax=Plectus sambesii TaxID=2011161 RepID=A0A914WVV3_9BILA